MVKKKAATNKKQGPQDSIQLSKFSDSAKDVLWQYSSQIRDTFDELGLSDDEVEEAANDLVDHVIRLSIFHAGKDELVLTDHVNIAIGKLGDPSTIKNVLEVDSINESFESVQVADDKKFVFTARHLVGSYWLLSWFLTGSLIFMGFKYEEFRWIGSILYILTIIFLLSVRSSKFYKRNNYIRSNMGLNFHILLFPFIFELISIFYLEVSAIIMDPIIITAWLMILSTKEFRDLSRKYLKSMSRQEVRNQSE